MTGCSAVYSSFVSQSMILSFSRTSVPIGRVSLIFASMRFAGAVCVMVTLADFTPKWQLCPLISGSFG